MSALRYTGKLKQYYLRQTRRRYRAGDLVEVDSPKVAQELLASGEFEYADEPDRNVPARERKPVPTTAETDSRDPGLDS